MPRIRTIKPDFWVDEDVADLSRDARLMFIGSWNQADDAGIVRWTPEYLKSSVFLYDDDLTAPKVKRLMTEVEGQDFARPFEGKAGQRVAWLPSFCKNQRIEKPQPSRYPIPEGFPERYPDKLHKLFPEQFPESFPEGSVEGIPPGMEWKRNGMEMELLFGEFYDEYPRHQGRKAAERAFAKAVSSGADPKLLTESAKRYRDDPNRDERYTKMPATWLNQGCWDDDPLPERSDRPAGPVLPPDFDPDAP